MQTGTMRLRELTVRYSVRKDDEGQPVVVGRDLSNPRETASVLMTALQDQAGEVFAILCVSTKHRVIAFHEVSRGTLDATLVHPREVFKAALLANAAAIILTHNHPSGDPSPSADDVQLTRASLMPARCSASTYSTTSSSATVATTASKRTPCCSARRRARLLSCQ